MPEVVQADLEQPCTLGGAVEVASPDVVRVYWLRIGARPCSATAAEKEDFHFPLSKV